MEKCLNNDVGLSWSKSKVQPGEQATLTLSAEPKSICSLGMCIVHLSNNIAAKHRNPKKYIYIGNCLLWDILGKIMCFTNLHG